MQNAQHVRAWGIWTTAAEDHTRYHSCQLRKINWDKQNWTTEDWKNVSGSEPWFQLWQSDGWVRIWPKQQERIARSFLVSTVQAGGGSVMASGIFSCHTLGPLVPTKPPCPSVTHLLRAGNTSCQKSQIISVWFVNMTMSSLYSNELRWPQ